jgi:hypothetical protein
MSLNLQSALNKGVAGKNKKTNEKIPVAIPWAFPVF